MSFIYKYKLYHLPFWFAYHYMWWTLTIGSASTVYEKIVHSPYVYKFLFAFIFQAIGVYFNLYLLIPKFLAKGKYVQYIGAVLLTTIATAAFCVLGYYASAAWSGSSFQDLFNMSPDNYMYIFKVNCLPSAAASMTLAMSLKLTKNWIQARQKQQLLEKEKMETELKFLRSQFNPHFLFNTINSIFVLIIKDPVVARESLAKFSDLLRYQLYECNEQEIPLEQELHYLVNFIELEKLRLDSSNLDLEVNIQEENFPDLMIAPFVLLPFVENAFKHLPQQRNRRNQVKIQAKREHNGLLFTIENSRSQRNNPKQVLSYGGIGLKNVQRRLHLVYPEAHRLTINDDGENYRVSLWLDLHRQANALPLMAENNY